MNYAELKHELSIMIAAYQATGRRKFRLRAEKLRQELEKYRGE